MDKRVLYQEHKAATAEAKGHVCVCIGVEKSKIENAVKDGADSFEAVNKATGAGGGCSFCQPIIEDIIAQ